MLTLKLGSFKSKHILVLYSLGLFAVIWVFGLLVYLPQAARNNELRAQLEERRQQVSLVEKFALAHPEADKYLAELDQRQIMLDKMLPNNPNLSDFILQVERGARESGVQVSQLKPAVSVNKEGYREIPVEILIKGNFFQTAAFIKKLEDGQRFMLVQNLSMLSKQGIIDSKLNISIYSHGNADPTQQPAPGKTNKK